MTVPRTVLRGSTPSVRTRVLALAWPAIVDQFLSMAVGVIDTAMVGRLGAPALAAVGLGAQVMMMATAVFSSVSTGTTALVARSIGAGEPEQARRVARQSLVMGTALALVTSFCLVTLGRAIVATLFAGGEAQVLADTTTYVRVVSMALVPQFLLIVINSILRGSGDTKTPMRVMAIVNLVNVTFNYLLIFGVGGFPRLEVRGAAIATALAHTVGGCTVMFILFGRGKTVRLSLSDSFRPEAVTLKRILNIGIPAGLEQAVMRIGQMGFTVIVASLGTISYAAHRIAMQAESLSFMPGFGFALAATALVGQGLGAEDPVWAEHSGMEAARLAATGMGFMGLMFLLFPRALVSVFTTDQEVIAQSAVVIRIVAISQPFMALNMVLAGGLRGAGDTRTVMLVTAIGVCGMRIVLAYILVRLGYGLVGAWVAMSIDLVTRGLLLHWRFRHGGWKHLRV